MVERIRTAQSGAGGSARAAERTLDILLAFLREGRALGISDISRIVRLPKATVHRLVTVLVQRGFLARDPSNAHYRIGLAPFRLGNLFLAQTEVRQAALPVIHELAQATGETVNLNVVIDRRRVCIEKAESRHDIRHFVELGRPSPLYAGASGKALLAFLDPPEIEAVMAEGLRGVAPRTITAPERLLRSLAEIRRRGYAMSTDERVAGASAVSAPLRNGSGRVVASLTISGPSYRFTPSRVRQYAGLVLEGARRVSAALGYVPPAGRRNGAVPVGR
ncbi:MAG: IclR family transcriptional regulator [Armatimonadetes bacterium]|nr:IclR family transcriptional regulator [Armatimonadota bacterium]